MTEEDLNFAQEIIKRYGEDRFYHAAVLAGCDILKLFHSIDPEGNWLEKSRELKIEAIGSYFVQHKNHREILCHILLVLVKSHKQFAIKTKQPPMNLHARMILGEPNQWVKEYVSELGNQG